MEIPIDLFSDDFVDDIKSFEGDVDYQKNISKTFTQDKFTPYFDKTKGAWIIGYGHKIKEGEYNKGITLEEADSLLISDLKDAYTSAKQQNMNFDELHPQVKEVLIDMQFNLGSGFDEEGNAKGVTKFNNFNRAVHLGNLEEATQYLQYEEPGELKQNLKKTDYYNTSPERVSSNMIKLMSTTQEAKVSSIDDKVMDMVAGIDNDNIEITAPNQELDVHIKSME